MRVEPVSFLRTAARLSTAELKSLDNVDSKSLEKALALGVQVVTGKGMGDSLLQSPAPPPALFAWGQTECLTSPMVAIVGTRGATTYGKAAAQKFAEAFARAGLTVVSGGAIGIDLHAHEGALEVGGNTIAVLANGVEHAQPPQNRPLFDRIRSSGCLVSPFAVGTPALKQKFRPRNELIAAMCLAVLVVEAPVNSGALMACGAAADMGREVFVVPGPINLPNYHGSHELIRDGATLVSTPDQVLRALDFQPAEQTKAPVDLTE
ncbi:MAG: DNA-protecting protein DprA, partial [Armatimonadetes bacterium]|nr:DNA-protecting protein DprA [Armatimonadota bacterium]